MLAAIEAGNVAAERLAQAHKLERELAWQRDRQDPLRAREVQAARKARSRASRAQQNRLKDR